MLYHITIELDLDEEPDPSLGVLYSNVETAIHERLSNSLDIPIISVKEVTDAG